MFRYFNPLPPCYAYGIFYVVFVVIEGTFTYTWCLVPGTFHCLTFFVYLGSERASALSHSPAAPESFVVLGVLLMLMKAERVFVEFMKSAFL